MGTRIALSAMLLFTSWSVCQAEDKKHDPKAVQRIQTARSSFAGEWEIVELKTRKPLDEGLRMPGVGDKVKFSGPLFLTFG